MFATIRVVSERLAFRVSILECEFRVSGVGIERFGCGGGLYSFSQKLALSSTAMEGSSRN